MQLKMPFTCFYMLAHVQFGMEGPFFANLLSSCVDPNIYEFMGLFCMVEDIALALVEMSMPMS